MYGVKFDFFENSKYFCSYFYLGESLIYIPKSKESNPSYYIWSNCDRYKYFVGHLGSGRCCLGKFFSSLTDVEQEEFITDIYPKLLHLEYY